MPHPAQPERGAALILVLLVTIVLFVIVSQVQHSAKMDLMIARNEQVWAQATESSRGAIEQAKQSLAEDLLDSISGGPLGGEGGGDNPFGGGDGGGDAGGEAGQGEDSGEPPLDHNQESWAREGDLDSQVEDMEILVRIEPENAKLNIIGMLAPEPYGELCEDQFVRLLIAFRADTGHDLSPGDASTIAKKLREYMTERRSKGKGEMPATALKSMVPPPEVEEGADGEEGEQPGDQPPPPNSGEMPDPYADEVLHLPLTLDELTVIDGIDESLLYDFEDSREIVPGLSNFVTVYSALNLDSELSARININFARRAVLEAIVPEDLTEMAEEIEEFRLNPPPAEWLEEEEQRKEQEQEQADQSGEIIEEEEEEEEEIEFPYFRDLGDLKFIESFADASENVLPEELRNAFLATIAVHSNVFSIHVKIIDQRKGLRRFARAVVFRTSTEGGSVRILPIIPFEWRKDPKLLLFPKEEPRDDWDEFENFDSFFR